MTRTPRPRAEELELILETNGWEADISKLTKLVKFVAGSAAEVCKITEADTRESVYAWAAGRSRPKPENERRLRVIAGLMGLVYEECGISAELSGSYLRSFNYDQTGMEEESRLYRLVNGEETQVYEEAVQYFIKHELA